ncbi:transcriptional repressor NrdR [Candidatus Woesearchaeota archaeon]|nr:transcriptional repressor NrdR [Candidatus Woesearchaeota archaeon]
MKCPFCGSLDSKVVDKRETEGHVATRRRRECLACGKRYTTYERLEAISLTVIKKDKTKETFDREKIVGGVVKACEKRPITHEMIDRLVDEVESELKAMDATEIESKKIGELVIKKLKRLDKVAYMRFASVYKEFSDIEEFNKELSKLLKK